MTCTHLSLRATVKHYICKNFSTINRPNKSNHEVMKNMWTFLNGILQQIDTLLAQYWDALLLVEVLLFVIMTWWNILKLLLNLWQSQVTNLYDDINSYPPFSNTFSFVSRLLSVGCMDRLFICAAWARKGYCESKRKLMQKHCPSSCDFCYGK